MRKIKLYDEVVFILNDILLALAVSMVAASDLGVSMVEGPAFLLSKLNLPWLTYGVAEYFVQGIMFVLMCLLIKKFRPVYIISFAVTVVGGLFIDLFRSVIPVLNPAYAPDIATRIALYAIGFAAYSTFRFIYA